MVSHVERKATNVPMRKSDLIQVEGMKIKKCRGRPKKILEVVKRAMTIKEVIEDIL